MSLVLKLGVAVYCSADRFLLIIRMLNVPWSCKKEFCLFVVLLVSCHVLRSGQNHSVPGLIDKLKKAKWLSVKKKNKKKAQPTHT